MSYPSNSPYGNRTSYTPPSGSRPPQRNTALIGGIVIACTALVLGSILLVTFVANRGDGDPSAEGSDGAEEAADGGETTAPAEEEAEGDPAEVAVAIVEVMYGLSDQSSEELVCADPGVLLADPEATREMADDILGDTSGLLEFAAGETTETDAGVTVEVNMIMGANEYPFGTVDLVVEDGSWKACGFAY